MKTVTPFDHWGTKLVPPSATLAINERSKKLISQGRHIIKFGFGESPFPVPSAIVRELKAHAHKKEYVAVQGLPALRQSVANYYSSEFNFQFSAEDIMIGPGSKELIFLIQMAITTGLLLPAPSWVSYAPQAQICNKPVTWIRTNEKNKWMLTAETLAQACASNPGHQLLILNYPGNPTGSFMGSDRSAELAEVARQNNLVVVSDEIYSPLQFSQQPDSLAHWYPEGTIVTGGLSKWCGAGGWRLGVAAFPESLHHLLTAVKGLASETFTAVSTPVQWAAVKAYEMTPETEHYLRQSRQILAAVAAYVRKELTSVGITMPACSGGFYLFPNFNKYGKSLMASGITDSTQLCERLLDDVGVALLPGVAFGRPSHEFTTRLAFVDFDGASAMDWLGKHGTGRGWQSSFIKACCPNIVLGTDKLVDWVLKL